MRLSSGIIWSTYCIYYRMWNVIISWTTTIISTIQILCYKYYPSPLAQRQMLVEDEQENRQDGRERSEKSNINADNYYYQNEMIHLN
jgi:hypothetical protein